MAKTTIVGLFAAVLCGCGTGVKEGGAKASIDPNALGQNEPAQRANPANSAPTKIAKSELVAPLLEEAARALEQNRLTLPAEDNARDLYRAVLMIDPQNAKAEAGLQEVALSYMSLIREAASNGRRALAQEYLALLRGNFTQSPLIAEAEQILQQLPKLQIQEEEQPQVPEPGLIERIDLPPAALASKDTSIVDLLSATAEKIKAQQARVIIFARSDAEGRWIYQTLKQAAEGYLIRGDIRVHSKPFLKLLEPLS